MGYPVLSSKPCPVRGKGMRLVASGSRFAPPGGDASSEAANAFGDGRLYLEKYLEKPAHIESNPG